MRSLNVSLTTEKNALDSASAWLPLISVWVTATVVVRITPNPTAVTFNGFTYVPFGLKIDEVAQDSKGGLADVMIHVSNVDRSMSAFLEANELRGAKVRLLYVNSLYIADPTALVLEEHYEITSIAVKGSKTVTFGLGQERVLSHQFPGSRFLRDNCRWIYRSPECGYTDNFAGIGVLSSAGVNVAGVGTLALSYLDVGDTITCAGQARVIAAVSNDLKFSVTVAPSPVWVSAAFTISKPICAKILGTNNGCRSHANAPRYGGFPLIPSVGGRLV